MEDYVFVCIGTNQLVQDSFGPRVGEILTKNFQKNSKIKIYGTMQTPVHFQNAPIFLKQFKRLKGSKIILIDSALAENETIGSTYVNFGGTEIGKAFGKSFYFPAHLNIKTVVGNGISNLIENQKNFYSRTQKVYQNEQIYYQKTIFQINQLAQEVANKITDTIIDL